jgi:hypothetical protein
MSDTPEHDFDTELRFKTAWVRSPEKEPTAAEQIEDALVEGGLPPAAVPGCVARIEEIANDLAMTHAAEFVAHVLKSLDGTAAAISLQRAILGSGGESIRDAADRAGVSSTAVFKQEQKIRARLRGG